MFYQWHPVRYTYKVNADGTNVSVGERFILQESGKD
jgi:hypothetical protein